MILLFTSSNDDYPLYKRDLLNVCCAPVKSQIQFAYKNNRIPEDLRSGQKMNSQDVLVIFCEPVSDTHPFYLFHPIRLGKIMLVPQPEHESLNITFELRGFFNYENYRKKGNKGIADQFKDFTDRFQKYVLSDDKNPGGSEPYCWVRTDKNLLNGAECGCSPPDLWRPSITDFSADSWLPVIRRLRECKGLDDTTFFSIQKQDTFGGAPTFLFPLTPKYEAGRATYKVNGGSKHRLVLYIPFVEKTKYPEPELKIEGTVASVSGPFMRQRSYGLEADFEVVFKRSFQQEMSMLELKLPGEAESSEQGKAPFELAFTRTSQQENSELQLRLPRESKLSGKIQAPELQALIIVRVAWWYLLIAVFFLAVGGIFAVISPAFIDELAKTNGITGTGFGNFLTTYKLTAFILTKALSFLCLAIGTFFGFNKLPFGK